jgi:hypothetical protein
MRDDTHEAAVIKALRLLEEAKSEVRWALRDQIEADRNGGNYGRFIQETLQAAEKRISSTSKELEKLVRRRADAPLDSVPFRPTQPKWGGGAPPFQIDLAEHRTQEPQQPEPPPPPPDPDH